MSKPTKNASKKTTAAAPKKLAAPKIPGRNPREYAVVSATWLRKIQTEFPTSANTASPTTGTTGGAAAESNKPSRVVKNPNNYTNIPSRQISHQSEQPVQTSRIPAPRADALDEELSRMAVAGKPSLIPPPKVVAQHGSGTNAPARGKMAAGGQGVAATGTKKGTGKMSGGRAAAPGKQQGAAGTIGAFDHVQVGVPGGGGVGGGSENIMNLVPPQDDNNVTITNFGGGAGGAPALVGAPAGGPHQSNPYQQQGAPLRYNDVAPAAQPGPLNNYHPATSSTSNPYGSPSGVGNNQNYLANNPLYQPAQYLQQPPGYGSYDHRAAPQHQHLQHPGATSTTTSPHQPQSSNMQLAGQNIVYPRGRRDPNAPHPHSPSTVQNPFVLGPAAPGQQHGSSSMMQQQQPTSMAPLGSQHVQHPGGGGGPPQSNYLAAPAPAQAGRAGPGVPVGAVGGPYHLQQRPGVGNVVAAPLQQYPNPYQQPGGPAPPVKNYYGQQHQPVPTGAGAGRMHCQRTGGQQEQYHQHVQPSNRVVNLDAPVRLESPRGGRKLVVHQRNINHNNMPPQNQFQPPGGVGGGHMPLQQLPGGGGAASGAAGPANNYPMQLQQPAPFPHTAHQPQILQLGHPHPPTSQLPPGAAAGPGGYAEFTPPANVGPPAAFGSAGGPSSGGSGAGMYGLMNNTPQLPSPGGVAAVAAPAPAHQQLPVTTHQLTNNRINSTKLFFDPEEEERLRRKRMDQARDLAQQVEEKRRQREEERLKMEEENRREDERIQREQEEMRHRYEQEVGPGRGSSSTNDPPQMMHSSTPNLQNSTTGPPPGHHQENYNHANNYQSNYGEVEISVQGGGIVPQGGGGGGTHAPAGAPPPQPLPATYSNDYNQQPMNNYNSYQQAPAPIMQQNQNLSQNPNLYGSPNMYAGSSLGGHDSSFQEEDYNYGIENTSMQQQTHLQPHLSTTNQKQSYQNQQDVDRQRQADKVRRRIRRKRRELEELEKQGEMNPTPEYLQELSEHCNNLKNQLDRLRSKALASDYEDSPFLSGRGAGPPGGTNTGGASSLGVGLGVGGGLHDNMGAANGTAGGGMAGGAAQPSHMETFGC
ncbi:unnamed protein product [Amoebophrya sp. A120]|nr:unnamed protein product [Amoebophrya sp. A120]|eukprot:GSA120T00022274001.1